MIKQAHTCAKTTTDLLLQIKCNPSSRFKVKNASSISHRRAYSRAISARGKTVGLQTFVKYCLSSPPWRNWTCRTTYLPLIFQAPSHTNRSKDFIPVVVY